MKTLVSLAVLILTICSPAMTRAAERTKHVNANGYTFTYVEAGKGEPVILVHGALADYRSAGEVSERLATRFRVIRYSRRYHYPDKPAQVTDYSPDVHARDLVALIRALHLDRVHLVGHSYGGVVAMLAAASAPDLIRTVTLEEPALMSLIDGTDLMEQQKKERATVMADIRQKFDNAFVLIRAVQIPPRKPARLRRFARGPGTGLWEAKVVLGASWANGEPPGLSL